MTAYAIDHYWTGNIYNSGYNGADPENPYPFSQVWPSVIDGGMPNIQPALQAEFVGGYGWVDIKRPIIAFDTSTIVGNIDTAYLVLNVKTWSATAESYSLVAQLVGTPNVPPNNPGSLSEYLPANFTLNGGSIAASSIPESGYLVIELNATGISWINKSGYTYFGLRWQQDIDYTEPTDDVQQIEFSSKGYHYVGGEWVWVGEGDIPNQLYINQVPPSSPVVTLPATGVDYYFGKATLNGTQSGMTYVAFLYGVDNPPTRLTSVLTGGSGAFAITVHGLARGHTYYFQARGSDVNLTPYFGEILSFDVVLPVGDPAYITKLIIHGQPLVPLQTVTMSATDAPSIAKYGRRTYNLSTQFSLSQDDTQIVLDEILQDNSQPRVNNLSVTFQNLKPGALKDSIIAADISTRITLKNTLLGLAGDFFINNIAHSVVDAGLSYTVKWRLERIYD